MDDERRSTLKVDIPENPVIEVKIKPHLNLDADTLDNAFWLLESSEYEELCFSPLPLGPYHPCVGIQANIIQYGLVLTFHFNHVVADLVTISSLFWMFSRHVSLHFGGKPLVPTNIVPLVAQDRSPCFKVLKGTSLTE